MSQEQQVTVGDLKLWVIDDGAKTWIAAASEEIAAREFELMVGPLVEDEYDIFPENIDREFFNEGHPDEREKASEMMAELATADPQRGYLIAATDW